MKDMLMIIDMQNAYLPGNPWSCPSMPKAVQNVQKLLEHPACGSAYDVVFTRYLAPERPKSRWQVYNRVYEQINNNPYLNQIVPQLQPFLMKWPLYDKSVYSSLHVPAIRNMLPDYDRILLCGVSAECCVLSTALELVDTGACIVYLRDASAAKSTAFDQITLSEMESFSPIHIQVEATEEYLSHL